MCSKRGTQIVMYELDYVRKRKRRRVVAIGTSIGAMGVSVLAIVAFLGRFVGTFTVTVNNGDVNLSLCESSTFDHPESMLRLNNLPFYEETTYSHLPDSAILDNEETPYTYGANTDEKNEIISFNYLKYTFFIKNVGSNTAQYKIRYEITENKPGEDGRSLDDTIRVMIFDNEGVSADHSNKVYAKEAAEVNYKADGTETMQEFISTYPYNNTEDESHKLAEKFASSALVTEYNVTKFKPNDMRRITIVTWLEGEDPQSAGLPPKGASLKLGVTINAYEN